LQQRQQRKQIDRRATLGNNEEKVDLGCRKYYIKGGAPGCAGRRPGDSDIFGMDQ